MVLPNEVIDAITRSYYALRVRSIVNPLRGDEVQLVERLCEFIAEAKGESVNVIKGKYTKLISESISPEDLGVTERNEYAGII